MTDQNREPDHHGVETNSTGDYPNETLRLLHERSSCRSFYKKEIPEDIMTAVLQAGTHSPTGGNLQPYSIIRIEKEPVKQELCRLCGDQSFIATAPTNLLFCIDWHRLQRWAKLELAPFAATSSFRHFWISIQDTVIAAQNICTAADALGLGSVYVGTVLECFRDLRRMFELPDGVFPVVLLSLGYPKERPKPKRKHDISIITHREKYRRLTDEEIVAAYNEKYPYEGVDATEERLAELERVSRRIHGEEFARQSVETTRARGKVRVAQRYFGLHYTADTMAADNEEYLRIMEEFGCHWFKEFVPPGHE